MLEVTYKGSNQVRDSKANLLIREYELYEIKLRKTI